METISYLIAPVTREIFLNEIWPDQPFAVHGPLERLPAPFTAPILQDFAALSAQYRGRILFGSSKSGPKSLMADHLPAAGLFEMGLSLYLPDIEPYLPGATDFLRGLEADLGLANGDARITAWASPADDGIACHFDAEDVFSIQIAGTKRFHVGETAALVNPVGYQYGPGIMPATDMFAQMRHGFPDPETAVFSETIMQPGSVLFVPRGHWHRTEAAAHSLSLTVVISPMTRADAMLRTMRGILLQNPAWRRPTYGANTTRGHGDLNALVAGLVDVVRQIEVSDLQPRPSGTEQWFQRVPSARLHAEELPEHLTVQVRFVTRMGGRGDPVRLNDIAWPLGAAAMVRWLGERDAAFAMPDMARATPDMTEDDRLLVLGALIRAGAVVPVSYKPVPQDNE